MTEKRVQLNSVLSRQLPAYVRDEFPLISEFLKQYYISQEYEGGSLDLLQNIDQYIKLENNTNLSESVVLNTALSPLDSTISVNVSQSQNGTKGFPDSYGILKINEEIITYTGKTDNSFTGCIRGFSGVSSLKQQTKPETLVFESTTATSHLSGSTITNLSCLFLKEFLTKIKTQILPGLEDRTLSTEINQETFLKQSKDFYLSKGTDRAFEILFKALYNDNVKLVNPREFLFTPSNAGYQITDDLILESVSGNPENLPNTTLFQEEYNSNIFKSYAPISSIEPIYAGVGKTFYKAKLDSGYNRDIRVSGATYGTFSITPKTRLIGTASTGESILNVDSTVGFAKTGEIQVNYNNNTTGIATYTSKTLNQFFGVIGIDGVLNNASTVGINTFPYAIELDGESEIKVKINSIIEKLSYPENASKYGIGDVARIKTLGIHEKTFKGKNWIYNISPIYKVKTITLVDASDFTYKVELEVKSYFNIGDKTTLLGSDSTEKESVIVDIQSDKIFLIRGQGVLTTDLTYNVRRDLNTIRSNSFPNSISYQTDVQNVYKEKSLSKYLIASSSIPFYNAQPIDSTDGTVIFSGSFNAGDTFEISPINDHGFYTGDAIYYTPEKVDKKKVSAAGTVVTEKVVESSLFSEGLYFIKRISDSTVKFAKSKADINSSKFVLLNSSTTIKNNKIAPYSFNGKTLESQKLLREIANPVGAGSKTKTDPGFTGVLINGVELLNYKSNEFVNYGEIKNINVLSTGNGFDIINPPSLIISDSVGTAATGYVAVSGSLSEIRIVDRGFDYEETPKISISGGNGKDAKASVIMTQVRNSVKFVSENVGLGATNSTIGFGTYHKFRNGEQVIYKTDDQTNVGGLTTNAQYFVAVQDNISVKLHNNLNEVIAGVNTVTLSSVGVGNHILESVNLKSVVDSISVTNPGSGYQSKEKTTSPIGINTAIDVITINNHEYESGEIIKYSCVGTPITGLSTNTDYYVTKLDDSRFKLSTVGAATSDKDVFYKTKRYVDLTSIGVGTHHFNYQDITISLVGKVGITSIGTETFKAKVQPIFKGEITSIHLENNGVGYGSSEIINFERLPDISVTSGTLAQVKPVINAAGTITEVLVDNRGKNYLSPPDLVIDGDGVGAVLVPIVSNGLLIEVKVISGGTGYSQNDSITVSTTGSDAVFKPVLQSWRINLFEKYSSRISADDGFIVNGINSDYGLQYSCLYAPRKLRESIFSVDQLGNKLFGKFDLTKENSIEKESTQHSPIIGWAYDGNPIYGPYGYNNKDGGIISQMRSGYVENLSSINRPPFDAGFFVEDYSYVDLSVDNVLDENNGRFCITPEFPKGTYAYFATINNTSVESSGPFVRFKKPVFPYIIGENYNNKPNSFNFEKSSNQDDFDFNEGTWCRNTEPYNLIEGESNYEYFNIPDELSQTASVTEISPGTVDSIGISSSGNLYKIGDKLVFNDNGTSGTGAAAEVSRIHGKTVTSVSLATTSFSNVEFYPSDVNGEYVALSENPHKLLNKDIIVVSGMSTTTSQLEGQFVAGISSARFTAVGIGSSGIAIQNTATTGIVTFLKVAGPLESIRENDILTVGTERIKVLNIDPEFSRIRILRNQDGTTGAAYTVGSTIIEDSRRIKFKSGFKSNYNFKNNKQIYFNPVESVGLGTTAVGIGSTVFFGNPGAGKTNIDIPIKSIYIRNHQLQTGDQIVYSKGNGDGIIVNEEGSVGTAVTLTEGQTLFIARLSADLIGLSTVRVGLGTTTFVGIASTNRNSRTLFFAGIGTGSFHSLKTNHVTITGQVERNLVTVTTTEAHGIEGDHVAFMDVRPSIASSVVVKYNDNARRVVINPKNFVSAGVNTATNMITISSHGYSTGDKVIHTASTPSAGLENNGLYYVIFFDNNNFKLAETLFDSELLVPNAIGITSASDGTLGLVNPRINTYRNSIINFDISDSSLSYENLSIRYPAFEFNLYSDENYTQKYNKNVEDTNFAVTRSGRTGIGTASVSLSISNGTPDNLYYRLDPVYESDLPDTKKQISTDSEVIGNNELIVGESVYSGTHPVNSTSSNTFTYSVAKTPERVSYASTEGSLTYQTDCTHTEGSIASVKVTNRGRNYYSIPGITTVTSTEGTGALFTVESASIGKIKSTNINNIGYDFPTDSTLKPTVQIPQIIKIDSLSSINFIGITSYGRGYTQPAKLIVLDGKTGQVVNDVDLKYSLGDSLVTILKNTTGINNITPTIIPTENSNGVRIGNVGYSTITKDVTITLADQFSSNDTFPFVIGDKVLIEGVGVGIGSTAKGYDSSAYNYKLFTLTGIEPNIGGVGIVTYSMATEYPEDNLFPGSFDSVNSSGRIISQKTFPTFDVLLSSNDYLKGETIRSDSSTGIVDGWDNKTNLLRASTNEDFVVGELIVGETSKTQGIASSITTYDSYFDLNAISTFNRGWQTNSGYLNDNLQRVQDSDYYQNFSYSLKSRIPFDTWNESVSALTHTTGFKKFSDLQIESTSSNITVGLSTDLTTTSLISDLIGYGNLNCVYDFDLVKENSLNVNSRIVSDEIIFTNRVLQDFQESVGNRVLSIDDLSGQFNSNPRSSEFTVASTFPLSERRALKYFTYVKDRRFTQERQLLIVDLIHDGSFGYINQYGRVESVYDQGSFDFAISGTEGQLQFYPTKFTINDFNITALSYNLDDNLLSTGSTALGRSIIDTESVNVSVGNTATIVSIASTFTTAKVIVQITPDTEVNEFEMNELNIVHNGSDIQLLEYGAMTTTPGAYGPSGLGTYVPRIDGSLLKVDFIPNAGVGIGTTGVINTITVGLASSAFSGIGTIDMKHARLENRTTSIGATSSPIENKIAEFPSYLAYDAAYLVVQVADKTNNNYQMSEFAVVQDFEDGQPTLDTYDVEYGNIETHIGLGTIGSKLVGSGATTVTEIVFTPNPSIDVEVNVFMNALRIQDDAKDQIGFNNGVIETGFSRYDGTESSIKREFDLKHKNDDIFKRTIDGSDSSLVNVLNNTVQISNHFLVTGESIKYSHLGVGATMAIGCASTTFPGVGVTTKLPENLFVVKINDNLIKFASTAENALKTTPELVDITSVGIGTSHSFTATNQNSKAIIAIDNLIQSPIVSTALTTTLSDQVFTTDDLIKFSGITSFFGGDLIQIGSEIMKIEGVGIGTTNAIRVRRPWMGTALAGYSTGTVVTKVAGNYNIVDNTLNFVEAPFGNTPLGTSTNPPDERDWTGISTGSSFQGRVFLRSGEINSVNETYSKNYIFDDISEQFNGSESTFTLKSNGTNVTGITSDTVLLINDIYQGRSSISDYEVIENSGISSAKFVGIARTLSGDVGISTFPKGGVIVSVASSAGFGYQPLVSAGGTAVVSAAGTIQSIGIGNTGSGYRVGLQTVNVSIESSVVAENVFIGTATISNGGITTVSISTNRVFYAPRDISNVNYSHTTGLTTVTTSTAHGLAFADKVVVSGIAFTCNYTGSGPVNVSNAVYTNTTGIMTVTTSAAHNLSLTGQKSDVLLTGLGFTCALGVGIHTYPRITDPVYCGAKVTAVNSATEFEVNAGVSTVPTFYSSGGTAQPVIIAPRASNNSPSGNDPAIDGSTISRIVNSTSFEINTGISTREHFYARCGKVNRPLRVVFDEPLSYSNIPLVYSSTSSGIGTSATIDVVVGQGSSVIDFTITNSGFGYGNGQTLTLPLTGVTGIPTSSSASFTEFEVDIEKVISDKFASWSVGQLRQFDNIERFIDGETKTFQMTFDGDVQSIVSSKGSKVDVQDTLLVFVNDILQVPGEGYEFTGGSLLTFTEPPKIGDTVKIVFYRGSGDSDVINREIIETVKIGDDLTIGYDASIGQSRFLQEDDRTVTRINSTDSVDTNSYFGPGNTEDETLTRPVVWCRQTEDKIIEEKEVGKDRELYESNINPKSYLIKSIGIGNTIFYVDRVRPLFDGVDENGLSRSFQNNITIKPTDEKVSAAGTAIVSTAGTVTSVAISTGGVGYGVTPIVSIASTNGVGIGTTTTATATTTISIGATVSNVTITNGGSGYSQSNPPLVLFGPPKSNTETSSVLSYTGDSGIIVGFGTTSVGITTNQLIFDLHIPYDSPMRNTSLVGTAITLSTLTTNDYFVVKDTNVGIAATSIQSFVGSGTTIAVGKQFADNVYVVNSVSEVSKNIVGVNTLVKRVTVNVDQFTDGYSGVSTAESFGNYSWGKIIVTGRTESETYTAHTLSGIGTNEITGISTSTVVERTNKLKFKEYVV